MQPEERRIQRLRRLERLRAIAKRQLAAETAEAEGVLAQLRSLTERTRSLAEDYATRGDALDGYALTQSCRFAAGLCQIVNSSGKEAANAQVLADRKMTELAAAERRRAAVEQRLDLEQKAIVKRKEIRAGDARRKFGTELE